MRFLTIVLGEAFSIGLIVICARKLWLLRNTPAARLARLDKWGDRKIAKIDKELKRAQAEAGKNIIKLEAIQANRIRVRLDVLLKLRSIDGISTDEIEQRYKERSL